MSKLNLEAALAQLNAEADPAHQQRRASRIQTEEKAALVAQTVATDEIASNPVYKIVEDTSKTNEQVMVELQEYLTTVDNNHEESAKRFAEFQTYFAYVQEQSTARELQNMQDLKAELEAEVKATIAKITEDLTKVQQGIARSDKLLDITASAAEQNRTLAEITAEKERNDQLKQEIKDLETALAILQGTEKTQTQDVADRQTEVDFEKERRTKSETGFGAFKHSLFGADKAIAADLARAEGKLADAKAALATTKESITSTEGNIAEKNTTYKAELDSGAFAVLQTMEETEEDINKNIIATVEDSVTLIRGAQAQVLSLIKRAAYSEARAQDVGKEIDKAERRAIILQSAISTVSDTTKKQSEDNAINLAEIQQKVSEAEPGSMEESLAKIQEVELKQHSENSQKYEQSLNDSLRDFGVLQGENVEARSRAKQFNTFAQSLSRTFKHLNMVSLPNTARQLSMMLEVQHALQTSEIGKAVAAVDQAGKELSSEQLSKTIRATQTVHEQALKAMKDLTATIVASDDANVAYGQSLIEQGKEMRVAQNELSQATASLTSTLEDLTKLQTALTGRADGPSRPEAAASGPAADSPAPGKKSGS